MNIPKVASPDALKNTIGEAKEKVARVTGKVTQMFHDKKHESATNLQVNDSDFVGDTENTAEIKERTDRDSEQLRNQADSDLEREDRDELPEEDVA